MQRKSIWQSAGRLFFLLLLVNTIGYIGGSYMTADTFAWYYSLPNSPLTPPDWVFPVVWTILFTMMAISAFLVWGRASPRWFVAQLMMNMLWSFSFFYLRNPVMALGALILMLIFLGLNIASFGKISKVSGWLLVPTFLWGLFALYLNLYIVYNKKKKKIQR